MNIPSLRTPTGLIGLLLMTVQPLWANSPAQSVEPAELWLSTSLYTRHYHADPRHNNHQRMLNLEWVADSALQPSALPSAWHHPDLRWLVGTASFRNSFGQQSTYLYAGARYAWFERANTRGYFKLTGGLLHGYRGAFRDKIPLNRFGVAPAVLPAVGVQHRRLSFEIVPFGAAGYTASMGLRLH